MRRFVSLVRPPTFWRFDSNDKNSILEYWQRVTVPDEVLDILEEGENEDLEFSEDDKQLVMTTNKGRRFVFEFIDANHRAARLYLEEEE